MIRYSAVCCGAVKATMISVYLGFICHSAFKIVSCCLLWIEHLPPVHRSSFRNPVLNNWLVYKFDTTEKPLFIVFFSVYISCVFTYLNILQYDNTLFFICLVFMSQIVFIFDKYSCTFLFHRRSLDTFYIF